MSTMVFDVISIFPGFFHSMLEFGLLKRAIEAKQIEIRLHDLREFTENRHRTVDDRPFGGGPGMLFKPEPVFRAVETLRAESPGEVPPVILLSPQGRLLTQAVVEEMARQPRLVLIAGRYEGVDERVTEYLATDEISIGDYILSGGELAAAVIMESVTRLLPGAIGNQTSPEQESFATYEPGASGARGGILDFPQYTRPAEFRGMRVPEVLLSGNHEEVREWRRRKALQKTWRRRPELLERFQLSDEDRKILSEIKSTRCETVTQRA